MTTAPAGRILVPWPGIKTALPEVEVQCQPLTNMEVPRFSYMHRTNLDFFHFHTL